MAQLSASAPALLTAPGALDAPLGGTQRRRGGRPPRPASSRARSLSAAGAARAGSLARGDRERRGGLRRRELGRRSRPRLRRAARRLRRRGRGRRGASSRPRPAISSDTLASLRLFVLVLAALVAAALGAAAVACSCGRALRPLGRLADAAAEIERTGDPRRRLPEPGRDDEVGRLATTLNAMLASLERAREARAALPRRRLARAAHAADRAARQRRVPRAARRDARARRGAARRTPSGSRGWRTTCSLSPARRRRRRRAEEVRLDELARRPRGERAEVVAAEPVACAATGPRSSARSRTSSRTRAVHGPAGGDHRRPRRRTAGSLRSSVTDEGPGLDADEAGARVRALLARRRRRRRAPGSASRSSGRPPSGTAAAPSSTAPGSRSSCRLSENSQSPAATTEARHLEKGSP